MQELPFLLEDKIRSVGGRYEKNELPWGVSSESHHRFFTSHAKQLSLTFI